MRGYADKLRKWKLPRETVQALRLYCQTTTETDIIHAAINDALGIGDGLHDYLYKHVTRNDYGWARLESAGMPCSRDTFRICRHRFYYCLYQRLNGANNAGANYGTIKTSK